MIYDYEGVTEVRQDREKRAVHVVANGEVHTIEDVDRLFLKGVSWIGSDGVAYLNAGRVSVDREKREVVAGD